jgi:restriction system protein
MRIKQAISEVMRIQGRSLSAQEAYELIVENNLYNFKAENPIHVVRTEIRRHCEGLSFASSSPTKHFVILRDGTYWLKDSFLEQKDYKISQQSSDLHSFEDLVLSHRRHLTLFKESLLTQLRELDPRDFEVFSKKVLEAYGFHEVNVTSVGRDGGVDGRGKLRVGMAELRVAFQSKRWTKKPIGRREISQFRGDIQGECEQGYFFTTSRIVEEAKEISFKPGTVPIIMFDGPAIVEIMMEKKLGVESENLPLYTSAIDLVISDDS